MESETRRDKSTDLLRLVGLILVVLGAVLLLGRIASVMVAAPRVPAPPPMPEMPAPPPMPEMPKMPRMLAVPPAPTPPRLPLLLSGLAATAIMIAGIYLIAQGVGRPSAPAAGPEAARPPAL